MNVFISWSGKTSQKIAEIFKYWMPEVLQSVKPFYSSHDISKGIISLELIGKELEQTKVGILMLTPSNIKSQWIHFEAGALSKERSVSKILPILFGLKNSDVTGPLTQFQATLFNKEDMLMLMRSLNQSLDSQLPESSLIRAFDRLWPELDEKISALDLTELPETVKVGRSENDILEEILQLVRTTQPTNSQPSNSNEKDLCRIITHVLQSMTAYALTERNVVVLRSHLKLAINIRSMLSFITYKTVQIAAAYKVSAESIEHLEAALQAFDPSFPEDENPELEKY